MKRQDERDASGLFLGSDPLDGKAPEREAAGRDGGKDGGHGPKDAADSDGTDTSEADGTDGADSDGTDGGDSDGSDKGDGGEDSKDADGKD